VGNTESLINNCAGMINAAVPGDQARAEQRGWILSNVSAELEDDRRTQLLVPRKLPEKSSFFCQQALI
jgi:hypothetical protein